MTYDIKGSLLMEYKKEIIENSKIGEKYIRILHPSGCKICLYPVKGCSSAAAVLGVDFGSIDNAFKTAEDKDFITVPEGTAHFLEHKMFDKKEGSAFKKYAETGADANAYTNYDKTFYSFSCSLDFEKNLEILLRLVGEPYFTEETVAKEQGIIGQEINLYRDDPWRIVLYNGLQAVYFNNPVRNGVVGTAESIGKIDRDLLYKCYNAFYRADNMVLAAAGNIDVDRTLEICDRLLKKPADCEIQRLVPDEPYEVRERSVSAKASCALPLFEIMYKFPNMTGEEREKNNIVYQLLLKTCLGRSSAFYAKMYEQGLINDSFNVGVFSGRGFFVPTVSGESREPAMVKDRVNEELKRLKTDLPSREEFENVRKKAYGDLIMGFDYASGMAGTLLNCEMSGVSLFNSIDTVARITFEDIARALNKIDIDNCSISVAEPL